MAHPWSSHLIVPTGLKFDYYFSFVRSCKLSSFASNSTMVLVRLEMLVRMLYSRTVDRVEHLFSFVAWDNRAVCCSQTL